MIFAFHITLNSYLFPHFHIKYSKANEMRVIQDLNSFGEIITHAHCSVDEKKKYILLRVYHIRII
jgi:hypothetical protein